MSSTEIMLNNLKQHFLVNSYRKLAKKINISTSIVLNWSSGRSSPNLKNVDDIAYFLGIATYQLLIPNNTFNIDTPIWKDTLKSNLLNNINRLKYEKDIHESSFYKKVMSDNKMSYRSFLRYANGKNKNIAEILSVESYKLIESE